jgi:pyruvate/2-oxoglutarate dehydrogenase complex dihydrolipoamide dehydrogenase (E3) component
MNQLLPTLREAGGAHAEKILRAQGVNILKGSRVVDAVQDQESGKRTITLENGQQEVADAYVATAGIQPNNDFIPSEFLSPDGWVTVDENLQVKNNKLSGTFARESAQQSNHLPIFALGDIHRHPRVSYSLQH